jgi:hypothetical protein
MPKAATTSLQQDGARPSGTGRTGAARGSIARTDSGSGQRERSGALSWLQGTSYNYGTLGASQQVPFTLNKTGGRASASHSGSGMKESERTTREPSLDLSGARLAFTPWSMRNPRPGARHHGHPKPATCHRAGPQRTRLAPGCGRVRRGGRARADLAACLERAAGSRRRAQMSSSPRAAKLVATPDGSRPWCWCPLWWTSRARSRCWRRAGSEMAVASPQRWFWGPRAPVLAHAFGHHGDAHKRSLEASHHRGRCHRRGQGPSLRTRHAAVHPPQVGEPFAPRALRTPLIEQLESEPQAVDPSVAGPAAVAAIRAGGGEELLPFAGQSAGLIHEVLPARELIRRLLSQAQAALERGAQLVR